MAIIEHGTTSRSGHHGGNITVYVVLSCMMAAMGGVLYGYDTGISGGVTSMDSFLKEFFPETYEKEEEAQSSNYCRFDSQLLTAFTSSLYVAGLVTSFVASHVTANFGRKPSIIAGGVAFLSAVPFAARLLISTCSLSVAFFLESGSALLIRQFLCICPKWHRRDTEGQSAMASNSALAPEF
ncbi:hypothetical protein L6164_023317 [Bauhinia variegata]|uniref:Uncharacterized protein n=1 Tax=Bauhinia variegata TaxID=167791 RepID=A0ACB9MLH4_BAUVA|nr:hypothetical protein L6164_023317 [Bauhinia variegata]